MSRFSRIWLLLCFLAVASFAQERSPWRTAADIREGARGYVVGTVVDIAEARNELELKIDDDFSRVKVVADAVTTQYNGFGGVINGKPEIFIGSPGFANIRVGDRLDVRGTGRGVGTVVAEQITLLGRVIPAPQTGVGTTRSPSTVTTPDTTPAAPERAGRLEGIIREINAREGRIVIETDRRELLTVRTTAETPVWYRGESYRVSNLEIGDRIRIDADAPRSGGEVRARSVEVTRAVQEGGDERRIGALSGRVTRVDRALDIVRIETARGVVRVDVATAVDETGRRVRAADFQIGDQVDLSGRYGPAGDIFIASTVRFAGRVDVVPEEPLGATLPLVTIHGTVRATLASSPQLVIEETTGGTTLRVHVLEDFLVRTRKGHTTADRLKEGDAVVIKAYRDSAGNYIAQTIRLR
ncbi:MAG TPA: DUF5666 domain-containing protein [Thermoanaerobaculia bacterium]|nr:DUF5666 domain-containing protein [Thermoanaerobaculia bacterium]